MTEKEASSCSATLTEKIQQGDVFSDKCPSRQILNHVTSRWGVLVLAALIDNTLRFSALRRRIQGVSEKMLAQTLQLLEGDGLVVRTAYQVVPPHVEYTLTPLGKEIACNVAALCDWIENNLSALLAQQEQAIVTA